MSRHSFVSMLALVASWSAEPALARAVTSEQPCDDPRVSVEGSLPERWQGPVDEACASLSEMQDLDPSARVRFTARADHLVLSVTLKDGRSAVRRVYSPAQLRLTFEALLTVPPSPGELEAAKTTEPAALRPPVASPSPQFEAEREGHALELGLGLDSRITGGPGYIFAGGSGYTGVRLAGWLIGFTARWDAFEFVIPPGAEGFELDAIGTGFFLAHPVLSTSMLELEAGGAALIVIESQNVMIDGANDLDSDTDIRLGGTLRALFGASKLRFGLGLDLEVSPIRLRHEVRFEPELPAFSSWDVGLTAGAVWTSY